MRRFFCPGAPFKYAPQHDWILVEITRRTGGCKFIFFVNLSRRAYSGILQNRLERAFSAAGLDFSSHVIFIPWQPTGKFFGLLKRAHVFLDTIGFSGFNTAIQAVECGIPVVTKQGKFMRGRLASGILQRMNLSELVAGSDEEYIATAVRLATDETYRNDIRTYIERENHILFDDMEANSALQEFFTRAVVSSGGNVTK